MTDSVKFLECFQTRNGVPEGTGIMAPQWVFDKVARGEALTEDDLRFCVSVKWDENASNNLGEKK